MIPRTVSSINETKSYPKRYVWGPASAVHEIGEYAIIEYQERASSNPKPDWVSRVLFHGYVNGRDTHQSFESLDAALVGCIGYKHEGGNGRAAGYFMKMIADE